MDFEFFEKCPPQVPLLLELMHERAVLIDALKLLDNADFFASVDLLIILDQLGDNLLKHALLGGVLRLRHEAIIEGGAHLLLLVRFGTTLQRLIAHDLLQNLQLCLLFILALPYGLRSVDPDRAHHSCSNVLYLTHIVQR